MGSCNSTEVQRNVKIKRKRISKISDETAMTEGDYLINEKYINHNDINKNYKLSKSVGNGATGTVCEGVDKNGKY